MAVIDGLPGFKVVVDVDGREAQEYDCPDPDDAIRRDDQKAPLVCVKYIESKAGKPFSIRATCWDEFVCDQDHTGYNDGVAISAHIDGRWADASMYRPWEATRATCYRSPIQFQGFTVFQNRMESRKGFRFSNITTTDAATHDQLRKDTVTAKDLGIIKVSVRLVRRISDGLPPLANTPDEPNQSTTISEKALKGRAVSHGTSADPPGPRTCSIRIQTQQSPLVGTVYFLYRSKRDLEIEGIIPAPLDDDDLLHGLSREDIERLARERLGQNEEEKDEENGRKKNRLKHQLEGTPPSPVPYKIVKTGDQEIVDLTDL